MTDDRPVVIVTGLDDPTADMVALALHELGVPVARLDHADFPQKLALSARIGGRGGWRGRITTPTRTVDLSAVRSV